MNAGTVSQNGNTRGGNCRALTSSSKGFSQKQTTISVKQTTNCYERGVNTIPSPPPFPLLPHPLSTEHRQKSTQDALSVSVKLKKLTEAKSRQFSLPSPHRRKTFTVADTRRGWVFSFLLFLLLKSRTVLEQNTDPPEQISRVGGMPLLSVCSFHYLAGKVIICFLFSLRADTSTAGPDTTQTTSLLVS